MSVSWAEGPVSIDELTDLADTVAHVTITRVAATGDIANDVGAPIPYTDVTATVMDQFIGDPHEEITIRQTGGTRDGETYLISDDPLMSVGEEYVLFLTEFELGHYRINGGPSGRLVVHGQTVAPLETSWIEPTEIPVSLADLADHLGR